MLINEWKEYFLAIKKGSYRVILCEKIIIQVFITNHFLCPNLGEMDWTSEGHRLIFSSKYLICNGFHLWLKIPNFFYNLFVASLDNKKTIKKQNTKRNKMWSLF